MGKKLGEKHSCSPIRNAHSGFVWSIFSMLKHNHWRHIKKRLPHKRLVIRRRAAGARKSGNNSKAPNSSESRARGNGTTESKMALQCLIQNRGFFFKPKRNPCCMQNFQVEEKSKNHSSEAKTSMRARIRAFITEEKSKRKGRHHRRSTYTFQSSSLQGDSSNPFETSELSALNDQRSKTYNQKAKPPPVLGSLNPLYLMSSEESSSSEHDDRYHNRSSRKKSNEKEKDTLLDSNSKKLEVDASPRQSKAYLEALNLITMNKGFLAKVFQDPELRLARRCGSLRNLSAKKLLPKTGSFPAPGSSSEKGSPFRKLETDQKTRDCENFAKENQSAGVDTGKDTLKLPTPLIAAEDREDAIRKFDEALVKSDDSTPGSSGQRPRKRGKSQVVMKRFKDLRQKIRHTIQDSQTERRRIAMDAILDKVPRRHGFSKDLGQNIFEQLKESPRSKREGHSVHQRMRRTSSITESLDRYLQLYECTFSQETKHYVQLGTEERALPHGRACKRLGRILSLPEMRSYSCKNEDYSDFHHPGIDIDKTANLSTMDEQESLDLSKDLEDRLELDASSTCDAAEQSENIEKTYPSAKDNLEPTSRLSSGARWEEELSDELDGLTRDKPDHKHETEDLRSFSEGSEESVLLETGFTFDEESGESPTDEEIESDTQHIWDELQQEFSMASHGMPGTNLEKEEVPALGAILRIDEKEKAKFSYVKGVLELSGLSSGKEPWHSDFHLLDPSLYEESQGCVFHGPECSGYEEGGNCNNLLLFDLINEVLAEVYEKSYHYCPNPLLSLCRIHPMPSGHHVLKAVWANISRHMRPGPEEGWSLDYMVSRDLSRYDSWMNLQFDSECIGLEVEDIIFDELLEETIIEP